MFTLLVCSDVCGVKVNLELQFERCPTFDELVQRIDHAFFDEINALIDDGAVSAEGVALFEETAAPPGFNANSGQFHESGLLALNRVQIYDDDALQWKDMDTQRLALHEFDQLYVFPRSRRHLSANKDLPPPRPPVAAARRHGGASARTPAAVTPVSTRHGNVSTAAQPAGSSSSATPRQSATQASQSQPAQQQQPARQPSTTRRPRTSDGLDETRVFTQFDRGGKGLVTFSDWRHGFERVDITFNEGTLDELFRLYAGPVAPGARVSGGGNLAMKYSDFLNFSEAYPATFGALLSRSEDAQREDMMKSTIAAVKDRAVARRRREEELRAELDALKAQADDDARELRNAEADLEALWQRRAATSDEEQRLLEKEVRVRYQRELLNREERELQEATRRFEAIHQHSGYVSSNSVTSAGPTAGVTPRETRRY